MSYTIRLSVIIWLAVYQLVVQPSCNPSQSMVSYHNGSSRNSINLQQGLLSDVSDGQQGPGHSYCLKCGLIKRSVSTYKVEYAQLCKECQEIEDQGNVKLQVIINNKYPLKKNLDDCLSGIGKNVLIKVNEFKAQQDTKCDCENIDNNSYSQDVEKMWKKLVYNSGWGSCSTIQKDTLRKTYYDLWEKKILENIMIGLKLILHDNADLDSILWSTIEREDSDYFKYITTFNFDFLSGYIRNTEEENSFCIHRDVVSMINHYYYGQDLTSMSNPWSPTTNQELRLLSVWLDDNLVYDKGNLWPIIKWNVRCALLDIYTKNESLTVAIQEFKDWCIKNQKNDYEMTCGLSSIKRIFTGILAQHRNRSIFKLLSDYVNDSTGYYCYPWLDKDGLNQKKIDPQDTIYVEWLLDKKREGKEGFVEWHDQKAVSDMYGSQAGEDYLRQTKCEVNKITKSIREFVTEKNRCWKMIYKEAVDCILPDNRLLNVKEDAEVLNKLHNLVSEENYEGLLCYVGEVGAPYVKAIQEEIGKGLKGYVIDDNGAIAATIASYLPIQFPYFESALHEWKLTGKFKRLAARDMCNYLVKKKAFLEVKVKFIQDTEYIKVGFKEFLAWCKEENYCDDYRVDALFNIEKKLKEHVDIDCNENKDDALLDSELKEYLSVGSDEGVDIYAHWVGGDSERDFVSLCDGSLYERTVPSSLFAIFLQERKSSIDEVLKEIKAEKKRIIMSFRN
ncbi:MAG: hypothetical protein WBQ73_03705 [Candidatus Babeliales bacterium]